MNVAHAQGLGVILDVVYNHFGPVGEYLDESKRTPRGGAIRYADKRFWQLRALTVSNPAYWMREFHIDGFRFDATHAIIDDSPGHILQGMVGSIHIRSGYAIAEDARRDVLLVTPEAEGGMGFDAVWVDDFHHSVRVANTQENEGFGGFWRHSRGSA